MSNDADTCPHCGADHRGTFGAGKAATLATGLRLPFGARREAAGAPSPYPSLSEEAELAGTGEQRWDNAKSATLGAVVLALIAGGVIYSQYGENDGTRSETPAAHSAYGAIDMKAAHETPAPTIKSAAAQVAKPVPVTAAPSAARDALPTDTAGHTVAALPGTTDSLQATHDAIERGDLTTARRRFSKISGAQLYAANVQRTLAELTILERTRDGLLQVARGCEATGSWLCVRQNARDALAIDASNAEAQTLVEHAISRSGWLNKTPPATAHAPPRPNGATALASPTAPAFVAGPHAGTVAPAPAPAPARRSAAAPALTAHLRPIPAMPPLPVVAAPAPTVVTTKAAPVASDATRAGTGSHAPLTSSARAPAPAFIPMPDGPETAPIRAATPNAPAPAEPAPSHAATTQAPDDAPSPPTVRMPAPIIESVPVHTVATPQGAAATSTPDMPAPPATVRSSSPTATRTLASGDNAASGTRPKAPANNATDTDAEERAILESGWSKNQSSKQRPPWQ
jgi:hypothetical protein